MKQPNVIVIMVDQMKANASHLWGSRFNRTPGLERLAEHGAVYHRAYAAQPLCVPARISFWSALAPHSNGCRTNQDQMPDRLWHAFTAWREAGLTTALIGKDHCFGGPAHEGVFDVRCEISHYGFESAEPAQGMPWWQPQDAVSDAHGTRRVMEDRNAEIENVVHLNAASYAVTDYPEETYGTGLVTGQAIRFLEERGDEPFALWLSYPDPHTPYEAPRRHFEEIADKVELWPWRADEFDDAPERLRVLHAMMDLSGTPASEMKNLIACYHAMVNFIDEGVSDILDALERLKLRDDTIVVFCSDHGDFAGEHMMMAKGGAFYDCLTRIPLIVSWPGKFDSRCDVESPVSALDVVPTLLDLQDLPVPDDMDGRLLPGVTDAPARDVVFSAYGAGDPPFRLSDLARQKARAGRPAVAESLRRREWEGQRMMAFDGRWKFVHDPSGDLDELYDLTEDPLELYDLGRADEHAAVKERLLAEMRRWNPSAFQARERGELAI